MSATTKMVACIRCGRETEPIVTGGYAGYPARVEAGYCDRCAAARPADVRETDADDIDAEVF